MVKQFITQPEVVNTGNRARSLLSSPPERFSAPTGVQPGKMASDLLTLERQMTVGAGSW